MSGNGFHLNPLNTVAQLKLLQRMARFASDRAHDGGYQSTFRGRGLELVDIRPYEAGDDVRMIHWRISAKMNQPFVKVMREEHRSSILFLLDSNPSMHFAGKTISKYQKGLLMAASLNALAQKQKDRFAFANLLGGSWARLCNLAPLHGGYSQKWAQIQSSWEYSDRILEGNSIESELGLQSHAYETDKILHLVSTQRPTVILCSDFLNPKSQQVKKVLSITNAKRRICLALEDECDEILGDIPVLNLKKYYDTFFSERCVASGKNYRTQLKEHRLKTKEYVQRECSSFYHKFNISNAHDVVAEISRFLRSYSLWRDA